MDKKENKRTSEAKAKGLVAQKGKVGYIYGGMEKMREDEDEDESGVTVFDARTL